MTQQTIPDMPIPPPPPSHGKTDMKVVSLVVICIVLAAGLVSVLALYQPANLKTQLDQKNKEISGLQVEITHLTSELAGNATSYGNQIQSLNAQITNLTAALNSANSQIADALSIMTLNSTETLVPTTVRTINGSADIFQNALPYQGYIVVQATSNTTSTYAQTDYSGYGVTYSQNVTLGKSGTAAFPVLPTTVNIKIGSTDKTPFNCTVTVIFHY